MSSVAKHCKCKNVIGTLRGIWSVKDSTEIKEHFLEDRGSKTHGTRYAAGIRYYCQEKQANLLEG